MFTVPFALSVRHFISSVGADAGFAAIIGLAILVLLYFAQARETASLREQAEEAADQVAHLEYRLAELQRRAAPAAGAGAPAPAPAVAAGAPVPSRAVPPGPLLVPAAPAGVGAPALASATRLIPGFAEREISVHSNRAPAPAPVPVAAAQGGEPRSPAGGGGATVIDPPAPGPATAAGGANGSGARPSQPGPVAAAATPATGAPPRLAPTRPPAGPTRPPAGPTRPPARNGGARPPAPPRRNGDFSGPPPSRLRTVLMGLGALVVVGALVVILLTVTSSTSTPSSAASQTASGNAATKTRHKVTHRAPALKPASVTVAVLNGTSTPNLAHDVSVKLVGLGYKQSTIATATDQTLTATSVGYLPGQKRAAQLVAKALSLPPTSVAPVATSNQAVACPQAASCTAQVVVTVGSDLASAASSTSATPSAAGGTTSG